MTPTYNLTSTQVPSANPPAYGQALGDGSTGPFSTGMTIGVSHNLNLIHRKLQLAAQFGLCGYGVLTGLDLQPGTGLAVALTTGQAVADGLIELVVSPTNSYQTRLPVPLVLPASATSFAWLMNTGAITFSTSITAVPGAVFLGTVTTSATTVTGIDYSGRITIVDGQRTRTTADAWAPADIPSAATRVTTNTLSGTYHWDGVSWKLLADPVKQAINPYRSETLTADLSLSATDANLQLLIASGGDRTVTLPSSSAVTAGHSYTIHNVGDSMVTDQDHNVLIHNSDGSLNATLAAGQQTTVRPFMVGATLTMPASSTVSGP